MNKLTVAEMRDLEKQVSLGEISYSRMVELLNERFTKENIRLRKGIGLCLAAINGGLDGLELDNTCDVTENSFIIQQLKAQSEILNKAIADPPTPDKPTP